MYGKIFSSMYEGSMIGAGAVTFAVMGYVIANGMPDRSVGMQVELNPKLLAFILGESQEDVKKAIDKLCRPDPNSRSKEEEGRRLVRIGEFSYKVVNGQKYRDIRNEEERRIQNRIAKRRERERKSNGVNLTAHERLLEKAEGNGDSATIERLNQIEAARLDNLGSGA